MIEFLWNLASFILVIGVVVTVHEYGHFWVARKCGVKVQRFAIGFGKPLFTWRDKLDTEYAICALPLGGYVKMLDERVDDVKAHDKHLAFNNQSVYKRIAIVSAGPLANFIFAIVASMVIYMVGVRSALPVIADVSENSIASQAGLEPGHRIVSIDNDAVYGWRDALFSLMEKMGKERVEIEVSREGSLTQHLILDLSDWKLVDDKASPLLSLGITQYTPEITTQLAWIEKGSAADKAGLVQNDTVHLINGEPVNTWQDLVNIVKQSPNQALLFTISRGEQKLNVEVTPQVKEDETNRLVGFIGVAPYRKPWPEAYISEREYGPIDALLLGVDKTWQLIAVSFNTVVNLITGQVSVKNLSGPIGVAVGAGQSTSVGVVAMLEFLAFVSVSIGFFNLLPLPILDGGHLMYYIIELIRKKPVSEKTQELGFRIGALILLLLTSVALFNDFTRL